MYLIIGLGNPGTEYESTRHNVGFMVVEKLAAAHGIKLNKKSRLARWGLGTIAQESIVIAEPLTYMNNSGAAVKDILRSEGVGFERLIVIHDDMDLEPGRIRVRQNGGSGGHKGIRSIIGQLGDENFTRVRIGIGRPPGRQDPADYVLSPFSRREREEIDFAIIRAVEAIEHIISNGVDSAMNEFNRRTEE